MQIQNGNIIKIVQLKTRDRIVLPREVLKQLKLKEGDYIAFIRDPPGVRIRKAVFEIREEE